MIKLKNAILRVKIMLLHKIIAIKKYDNNVKIYKLQLLNTKQTIKNDQNVKIKIANVIFM